MLSTVLVFLVTLLLLLWWRSRPRNAPPSPGLALPVVGHFYLFKGDIMDQLEDWRRRLGNIYTLQMGPVRCVILNGYNIISEACIKHHESMLERPNNFLHKVIEKNVGIGSLGGRKWKEQRAFLQSKLRSLGMGRNAMAERIKVEVDYLLATIQSSEGKAIDIRGIVMVCVTNVICGVTFGKRFNKDDEEIVFWTRFQRRLFQLIGGAAVLNYFPVLKYVPGDRFQYKELTTAVELMRTTIWKWVEKDKRVVNVSDEAFEDIVQAFLTEMELKRIQGVTDTSIDEPNLVSSALGLFNAGTETSSTTIMFAVLYLVCFPKWQAKLYQEITDLVGTERAPNVTDKNKLRLLSAFIMETQRFGNIAPLTLDRVATSDINIGGYTIAKGSAIKINLDSVLKDKDTWGDPDVFRPDRFLDHDGAIVIKKEFTPFGIGKRNCAGEGLATMELFLFISALVQKFEFFPENEGEFPSLESIFGITRAPRPFKVRAVSRI